MPTAILSSKGRVTIPKPVREALGMKPGDRLEFVTRHDGVLEVRPHTIDLRHLVGAIEPTKQGISVADMDETIQAEGSQRI